MMRQIKFLELGLAFAQFSANTDENNYRSFCNVLSSLELETLDYNKIKEQTWWDFNLPKEWFVGDDGSLRNYYEIGMLSYLRFLLVLPPTANSRTEQIGEVEKKLEDLFTFESIPKSILKSYLSKVVEENPNTILTELRQSLYEFMKDKKEIFNELLEPPNQFDEKISESIKLTIDETSKCYKQECYIATIVLCGRIIETLTANAYISIIGENPLNDKNTTFKKMRDTLKEKGLSLYDTNNTEEKLLALIYDYRSVVFHSTIIPTQGQAKAIVILTQEAINITYRYFHDLDGNTKNLKENNSTKESHQDDVNSSKVDQDDTDPIRYQGALVYEYDGRNNQIIPDDRTITRNGKTVFVSIDELEKLDQEELGEGQRLEFSLENNNIGPYAKDITILRE